MTISSTTNKNQYNADGSTTSFTYVFRIIQSADIMAVLTNTTTGVDTIMPTSSYVVNGADDLLGGTVVFNVAPAVGNTVTLVRNAQAVQNTTFVPNDPFPSAVVEEALDRLTTVTQTVEEQASRSLQVGYGTKPSFNTILPSPESADAGKTIVVSDDLSGFQYGNPTFISGPETSVDSSVALFNGTNGDMIKSSLVIIDEAGNLVATSLSAPLVTTTLSEMVNAAVSNALTANLATIGNLTSPVANLNNLSVENVVVEPLAGNAGIIKFLDIGGVKYVAFRAPTSVSTATIYNLPPSDGMTGQVLTTDGLGNLSWQTGVPPKPFIGTLASLADVTFLALTTGDVFLTPNGSIWSNPAIGAAGSLQPYNTNISLINVAETRSASINMNNSAIKRAIYKVFTETFNQITAFTTTDIDLSIGNTFALHQGVDTSLSFINPSMTGLHSSFTLARLKDNSFSTRIITWPISVKWANGTAPTLTQSADAIDSFFFRTIDGGITWFGYPAALDLA